MQALTRTVAVLAVVLALVLAWGSYRFSHYHRLDLSRHMQDAVESQAAAVSHLLQLENDKTRFELNHLFASEAYERIKRQKFDRSAPLTTDLKASDYLGLVYLQLNAQGRWEPLWLSLSPDLLKWPPDFFARIIPSLPTARTQNPEYMNWSRLLAPNGQALMGVLKSVHFKSAGNNQQGLVLALLPMQHFGPLVQKTGGLDSYIINDQGLAFAYSEEQYLGSDLKSLPAVQKALNPLRFKGFEKWRGDSESWQLMAFNKVDNSNLVAISQTQLSVANSTFSTWLIESLLLWLGFILLGSVVLWWALSPLHRSLQFLRTNLQALAEDKPIGQPYGCDRLTQASRATFELLAKKLTASNEGSSADAEPESARTAVTDMGRGLYEALKGPLSAILGQAQLARSKTSKGDPELKNHFVVIERETRQAREVIEHLGKVIGVDPLQTKRIDLIEAMLSALAELRTELTNVKVEKHLSASVYVQANASELRLALTEILKNAAEALREVPVPVIKIYDEVTESHARLVIEDNGPGVPPQAYKKIFDPFFTTKEQPMHQGLGLSMALGMMRKIHGHLSLIAKDSPGTKMVLELPLATATRLRAVLTDAEDDLPAPSLTSQTQEGSSVDLSRDDELRLGGKLPITGSYEESFPATPAEDEVTFIGHVGEELDESLLSTPGPTPPVDGNTDDSNDEAENFVELRKAIPVESVKTVDTELKDMDGLAVAVRQPKARTEN